MTGCLCLLGKKFLDVRGLTSMILESKYKKKKNMANKEKEILCVVPNIFHLRGSDPKNL